MTSMSLGGSDPSTELSFVVGTLVVIIGVCAVVAITLAVMHYKEASSVSEKSSLGAQDRARATDSTEGAPACPATALPQIASTASLKSKRSDLSSRGFNSGGSGSGNGGASSKLRHRQHSGASLSTSVAAAGDQFSGSMYDTQETLDSAMVQEILGSVDAHHVRETQVLLSSFNWDLEELLHQEVNHGGKGL